MYKQQGSAVMAWCICLLSGAELFCDLLVHAIGIANKPLYLAK